MSKDKHAYLYDPKWQLAITINGQLLLTMLSEWVVEQTSYCKLLFENTDGAAFMIKRSEKHIVDNICKRMEDLCGIALEAQECKKLIMRDVNNYINVISKDSVKFKGAYEIDRDYHKNHSKRIVSLAAANYFINGIEPDETLSNHFDKKTYTLGKDYKSYGIYDFCIGNKSKYNNKLYERTLTKNGLNDEELGKVNRYYICNKGSQLIKKMPPLEKNKITDTEKLKLDSPGQIDIFSIIEDVQVEPKERITNIEAGYECTLFNIYKDQNDYDLNYKYYYNEIIKLNYSIWNSRRSRKSCWNNLYLHSKY